MGKKKLEITDAQLKAIMDLTDDISGMIGCGDDDSIWEENVRLIDRFLHKNGYKRNFN